MRFNYKIIAFYKHKLKNDKFKLSEIKKNNYKINFNPIFIIGCGHSGTTLLKKILGYHNYIYSLSNETEIFLPSKYNFEHQDYKVINKLFNFITLKNCKKTWCEKTPRHIRHIENIYKFYPNAKIIFIVRDGRDVVCSLQKRKWMGGCINKCIDRWVNDNNFYINSKFRRKIFKLRYEDLIYNFNNEITKILNYLNFPYQDLSLFYQQKENNKYYDPNFKINCNLSESECHNKLRLYQINKPLYDGSKRYITDMSKKDMEIFNSRDDAIKLMKYFEY